jgi:hypothetical protein
MQNAGKHFDSRGFSGAVGPDERDSLSLRDIHADSVHRDDFGHGAA